MNLRTGAMFLIAGVFGLFCTGVFSSGEYMEGNILGKWRLEIYGQKGKRINTVFIKEFRKDRTYSYRSTLYKRSGGVASRSEYDGTYKFKKVKRIEPGWPKEKVKGKQLYLLTREMDTKKGFIFTRYVQFENEHKVWIWGRAPGLSGLHHRVVENGN